EAVRVHAFADGNLPHDLAGLHIGHRDHLVIATRKDAAVRKVSGHARWFLARRQRIVLLDGQGLGVKGGELAVVFDVEEIGDRVIADRRFRFAAQLHRAHRLAADGIDRGGIFARAVEGEDAPGKSIIKNAVRPLANRYLRDFGKAFGVYDGDPVGAAFADIG